MYNNLSALGHLISQAYSEDEAIKSDSYRISNDEATLIAESGRYILNAYPSLPNSCAPMSAIWAAMIRDKTSIPTYLVAGCLDLNGKRIFGGDSTINNDGTLFDASNPCWDGHCWTVFGNVIGDISFFRTALSTTAPDWLKDMVLKSFGGKKGALLGELVYLESMGLKYNPKYVATDLQISSLIKGANQIIETQGGNK